LRSLYVCSQQLASRHVSKIKFSKLSFWTANKISNFNQTHPI
jgi:hypothetical protein